MAMKPIPKLIVIVGAVAAIGYGVNKTVQLSTLTAPPAPAPVAVEQLVQQYAPVVERAGVVTAESPRVVVETTPESVPVAPTTDASQDRGLKHLLRN